MAWIESHQELKDHPKTRKAARSLGIGIPQMIGHMHLLWWWALDYAEHGDISGFENYELADAAMWEGDPNEFVQALAQCGRPGAPGFIEVMECDGCITMTLRDWEDYAGRLVDQRAKNAAKQKAWRDRQRNGDVTDAPLNKEDNSNRYVTVTQPLRNGATVPYTTEQNITVPEEEGDASQAPPPTPLKQNKATSFPTTFEITPAMEVWAAKNVPELDIEEATEQWQDAMRANRTKYKYTDWGLAWQNAMRKAAQWQTERNTRSNRNGQDKRASAISNGFEDAFGMDLDTAFGGRHRRANEDHQTGVIRQLPRPKPQAG